MSRHAKADPDLACPACAHKLRRNARFWDCSNPHCGTRVLACPECQRPMLHIPVEGALARAYCQHCDQEYAERVIAMGAV
jgi:uncharacterized protein YbaR (Trm112 family)